MHEELCCFRTFYYHVIYTHSLFVRLLLGLLSSPLEGLWIDWLTNFLLRRMYEFSNLCPSAQLVNVIYRMS